MREAVRNVIAWLAAAEMRNVKGPLPDLAQRALITGELWSLT